RSKRDWSSDVCSSDLKAEGIATGILQSAREAGLTEGIAVREVSAAMPDDSRIFVANSMPVRDVETFFKATGKNIEIHANRGVSGIDGTIATALGMAAASGKHVTQDRKSTRLNSSH